MATDQRTLPGTFADDAGFRTWGSALSAQIAAVGMVQTADTGQINWTTVVKGTVGSLAGFEMWRFNDAWQATHPVFFKVEYGHQSAGGGVFNPIMRFQAGTATTGAGVMIGQSGGLRTNVQSQRQINRESVCSGGPGRFGLCTGIDTANFNSGLHYFIERTKLSDGTITTDGIISFSIQNFEFIPFVGKIPAFETRNNALNLGWGSEEYIDANTQSFAPCMVFYGKPRYASWLTYLTGGVTDLTPITFTHLGGPHTYLPLGKSIDSVTNTVTSLGRHSLLMLYE